MDLGNRLASPIRSRLIVVRPRAHRRPTRSGTGGRVRAHTARVRTCRRPVTVAVAVGVVVGLAQAAPLFQLPLFLHLVLGYGVVVATLAIAPFIVALVVAGPVAGFLHPLPATHAWSPPARAVGARATSSSARCSASDSPIPSSWPLVLIGAGFVVATTVRTAIIFASVSRGLPGTAAALNEASILVGSRIGLAVLTALITQRALDIYAGSLPALDPAATGPCDRASGTCSSRPAARRSASCSAP